MKKQIAALTLALAASIFSMSAMAAGTHVQEGEVLTTPHCEQDVLVLEKKPTCTEEGLNRYLCHDSTSDMQIFHEEIIKPNGHTLVNRVVTKDPTCIKPGEVSYTCSVCKAVITEPLTIDKNDDRVEYHNWVDWTVDVPATCWSEGTDVRWCKDCGRKVFRTTPKLEAKLEVVKKEVVNCYQTRYYYECSICHGSHKVDSKDVAIVGHSKDDPENQILRDAVTHDIPHVEPALHKCAPTCETPGYILYACKYYESNPAHEAPERLVVEKEDGYKHGDGVEKVVIPATGHTWGEWNKRYQSGDSIYWLRTCKTCKKSEEKISDTKPSDDDVKPTDPEKKNGLYKDADGVYRHYTDGKVDTFTGIAPFEGGEFFVANGVLCSNANGLSQNVDGKWYFLSQGQIQRDATEARYDGATFKLNKGELDTTANGIYSYDTGKFLFAAGKLRSDVQGLWQAADGTWYFLANGQVQDQYTGLALYDGHWFYINKGVFDPTFAGKVEHDGATFDVVNGQVF